MQHLNKPTSRSSIALKLGAAVCGVLSLQASPVSAQTSDGASSDGWYARTWGGYSALSDTDGSILDYGFEGSEDRIDVSTEGGFTAGAGIGYRYGPRIGVEVAWEYRTNDSETVLAAGPQFPDGNYASNTFFLNGFYYLNRRGPWEPYLGAGLAWVQEVDIDLEDAGAEQSFSGDGDVGIQVFVGTNYRLSEHWSAHGELRYGSISGIDLEGENVGGVIRDFDYKPVTAQLGLSYNF